MYTNWQQIRLKLFRKDKNSKIYGRIQSHDVHIRNRRSNLLSYAVNILMTEKTTHKIKLNIIVYFDRKHVTYGGVQYHLNPYKSQV